MIEVMLKRLKEERIKRNKSQEQIGKIINTDRITYNKIENGHRELSIEQLVTLANYYGLAVDYIIGRTDNPFFDNANTQDETEYIIKTLKVYREMKQKLKLSNQ